MRTKPDARVDVATVNAHTFNTVSVVLNLTQLFGFHGVL